VLAVPGLTSKRYFQLLVIGVIANPLEHAVVREFFELFKTPWEFYEHGRKYDVLLCAGDGEYSRNAAKLVLIYSGHKLSFDETAKIGVAPQMTKPGTVSHKGFSIPIYGDSVAFAEDASCVVHREWRPGAKRGEDSEASVARVGYDLFKEVRALLTEGQPEENAAVPTLELHIALLRELIVASGVQVFEVPPVPAGYRMIACLTHDVDHPSIRLHKFDHTMLGFIFRAIFGSLIGLVQGRISVGDLLANWGAVAKLPFVYLGLAKDFWSGFDGYIDIERGLGSSFFVIPFKDRPGRNGSGDAPSSRAARYGVADLTVQIGRLMAAGCEIGVHGIDAWRDSASGYEELQEVRRITGVPDLGVRMHWLYFEEGSAAVLEEAGASYDSSFGYNGTVGYRAGTTQVFKPLSVSRLLELPLHIMDTALFYPGYLHLPPREAQKQVNQIIANATQFGGVVTVNWHDRSLSPERLWGGVYVGLVDELKRQGAWFATATEVVSWFQKRRSVVFDNVGCEPRTKIAVEGDDGLPALQLRVHNGRQERQEFAIQPVPSRPSGLEVNNAGYQCVALS
jgi:hypothetical protein